MEASFTILILVLMAAGTAFWLWALVDVLRRQSSAEYRTGTQVVWAVVIGLTHSLGAFVYVIFGRPRSPNGARVAQ